MTDPVHGGSRVLEKPKATDDPAANDAELEQLRVELAIAREQAGYGPGVDVRVWVYEVGEYDDDPVDPYFTDAGARHDAETWWKSENPERENPTFEWKPRAARTELYALGRPTGITVRPQTLRRAAA